MASYTGRLSLAVLLLLASACSPVIQECENISGSLTRDLCYSDHAAADKDLTLCNAVNDSIEKERCFGGVARESGSPKICEMIKTQSELDWCYADVGVFTKNLTLCEKSADTVLKNICIEKILDS